METEQMAEVYGAPGTRPSDHAKAAKKQAKADKARAKMEKAMAGGTFTPAQRIMRIEMEVGVHKLDSLLEEVAGPVSDDTEAQQVALTLIRQIDLTLSYAQWAVIQTLVERAYRTGKAAAEL